MSEQEDNTNPQASDDSAAGATAAVLDQDPSAESASETPAADQTFNSESARPGNLDVVLNIPVRLSMEVGHTKMTVRSLLKLGKGSVVELARMAGEPLDVLANGTLIAKGEVVVVDDNFGIRLLEVMSPEERLQSLN